MVVTLVHVRVKPEYLAAFIEAARENHEASIREAGNRRFDILLDNCQRFLKGQPLRNVVDKPRWF